MPALRRDNLKHLLRDLAERTGNISAYPEDGVSFHVVASILSTTDGIAKDGDRSVEVVLGTILGEDRMRPFTVGDVPASIPHDGFWNGRFFELPIFKPPAIDADGTNGISHLNLDEVLCAVIGDLL